MKKEDFEKIKNILLRQKNENKKLMAIYYNRYKMSRVSQSEHRLFSGIFFGALGYMGLFALSLYTNVIPTEYIIHIMLGGSVACGFAGNALINLKNKVASRTLSFTTAKKDYEKLENEIINQIELEKLINKNKSIDKTLDLLNSSVNNIITSELSSQSELHDEINKRTSESLQKNMELDVLSTQKIIHDRFLHFRTDNQDHIKMIFDSIVTGFIADTSFIPILLTNSNVLPPTTSSVMLTTFGPLTLGSVGAFAYLKKREKNNYKVYTKLNKKLKNNALPEKITDDLTEENTINSEINEKIEELSNIDFQLITKQIALESLNYKNTRNYTEYYDKTILKANAREDKIEELKLLRDNIDKTKDNELPKVYKK